MTRNQQTLLEWNAFWAPYREKLRNTTFTHLYWNQNWRRLYTSLSSDSGKITAVIGPTGIGKTTLIKETSASWLSDLGKSEENLCFVSMKRPKGNRQSSEKDLMSRIMNTIRFPGLTVRDLPQERHAEVAENRKRFSASMMEECLIEFAKQNPDVILVIEEIQHAADSGKKSFIEDMSALKTVVDAGMKVLLTGGYEGLDALDNDAHLKSRVNIIHFSPYRFDTHGFQEITQILEDVEAILPPGNDLSLLSNFDLIYNKCLGNVGTLISLTHAAITNACASEKNIIDADCIMPFQLESTARTVLLNEYKVGERRYGNLGFRTFSGSPADDDPSEEKEKEVKKQKSPGKSKGSKKSKSYRANQVRQQTGNAR